LTCRSFERQIFDSIDPFVRIRRFHGKFEIDDALADRNIELMSVDNTCETLTALLAQRGFPKQVLSMLDEQGIESVKLPPRSPNLNAHAEQFVRSIKESCLERMIFFGEDALRKAVHDFVAHYHFERNHQGLGNRLIVPLTTSVETVGTVQRRQRLGGLLNYYHRQAA